MAATASYTDRAAIAFHYVSDSTAGDFDDILASKIFRFIIDSTVFRHAEALSPK